MKLSPLWIVVDLRLAVEVTETASEAPKLFALLSAFPSFNRRVIVLVPAPLRETRALASVTLVYAFTFRQRFLPWTLEHFVMVLRIRSFRAVPLLMPSDTLIEHAWLHATPSFSPCLTELDVL